MENEHPYRRNAFNMYKELKIYFVNRTFEVIDYNGKGTVMSLPFSWVKISSRGVIIKEKNSGKKIHFKYSSIDSAHNGALKCEDVELFTPFIKEDNKVKFISWEEWNSKYSIEAIAHNIKTPSNGKLRECGTDLSWILDRINWCVNDHTHHENAYDMSVGHKNDEFFIEQYTATFKWYIAYDSYWHFHVLYKNNHIVIEAKKYEKYTMSNNPSYLFKGTPIFAQPLSRDIMTDYYVFDMYFIDDTIDQVIVTAKEKDQLLNFVDIGDKDIPMGNIIKKTIRDIKAYINNKLEQRTLKSTIHIAPSESKFSILGGSYRQIYSFVPRVDIKVDAPTDSVFKLNVGKDLYSQIKKELIGIFNDEPNCSTEVFTSGDEYKRYRTILKLGDNTTETLNFYYEDNRKKIEIHVSGILHYVNITITCNPYNTLESITVSGLNDVERIHNHRVKNLIEELVKLSQN